MNNTFLILVFLIGFFSGIGVLLSIKFLLPKKSKQDKNDEIEIIYGHSLVFNDSRVQIVRKNISPKFQDNLMKLGWFPSHQATNRKQQRLRQHLLLAPY